MNKQSPDQPSEHEIETAISSEKKIVWSKVIMNILGGVIMMGIGVFIGVYFSGQNSELQQITPDYTELTTAPPTTFVSEVPASVSPTVVSENDSWKTFDDVSVSFQYPREWTIYTDSHVFENGDIVQVRIVGATQKEQTEFYDGAFVSFMRPLSSTTSLNDYINQKHTQSETMDPDTYKRDTIQIGSHIYERVYACGLGCFTYYYFEKDSKIHGVVTFSEGPLSEQYSEAITRILESASFK